MNPAEIIKQRRLEKGLKEKDVWSSAGMTQSEYQDVEWDESEAFTALPLKWLRRICAYLDLDMLALIDGCLPASTVGEVPEDWICLRRHKLIEAARLRRGWSQDELGDQIGFQTVAIERMERDGAFLESWPVDLITELASLLDVPRTLLLTLGHEGDF